MKKSTALVQGLGTLALVSSLFAANQALANTAGGATIHNYATLTYGGGGSLRAAVNVGVQTVASLPTVVKSTADQTVPSYGTADYTFTVASTSNGSDTFALALLSADVNTAGAPGVSFLLNGNPVSTLVLGGSVTSQPSGAGVIYIPAGSEANLLVNTVIKVGSDLYTITAVTAGTAASTNTSTGVHTAEVPSSLTLTPVGAAPAITAGSVVAGVQIGQQVTLTQHVVASAPVTVSSSATHSVSFTATSTATNLSGSTVVYSSASNSTNTVTTVIVANTTLSKFVRNVTRLAGNSAATGSVTCNGAATYYAAGVVSKPSEVLEYCLKASVATGQPTLTAANLQDDVPAYTAYVAGTTTLNGTAVTETTLGTLPLSGAGMLVKSPGAVTAGEILPGETATVIFRVTVQ